MHDLPDGRQFTGRIGEPVTRLEDLPLVTGKGKFVADISFPAQLHMRVVRSPYAHGRIVGVDVAEALAMPGVKAIWTHADVADIGKIGFREGPVAELDPYRQPILAEDRVRYVGEPVAVVFAETQLQAENAADLVLIEVEELTPLLDCSAEPGRFDEDHSTEPTVLRKSFGDIDAAMRDAHLIVELDLRIGRHSGVPLETRGLLARHDAASDTLQVYGAAKVPHRTRDQIARLLGREPTSVHLFEGHVGGGFGIRGELYPEDLLVCLAALRMKRPIKWIEDRREHLIAANQSRDQRHIVRAAVDADGKILGLEDRFFHDQGAYIRTHATRVADLTAGMLPGPYKIPAYRVDGHFRMSNKTPAATYRSPGRYESTFVRERLMDVIAHRLGMDRITVRRINLIRPEDMPYALGIDALGEEVVYDSGKYELLLDKALARFDWDRVQDELAARRSRGELVGAGIGVFVEKSGLGPKDGAVVSADEHGRIEVLTGGASLGQGFETVMAQICCDALDLDYRDVTVIHGQTNRIAFGIGAHASRATVMTGSAVHIASLELRKKILDEAARLLQSDPASLEIRDGTVHVIGGAAHTTIADVVKSYADDQGLTGGERTLSAEGWHHTEHMAYPYGIHMAVVSVDAATGGVRIEKYLIAYDVGRAINPMLVESQIVGGFAQGLGGALLEAFTYDERGEPMATTLAEYLLPTMHDVPDIDTLVTEDAPSPLNPIGMKGAGEGGVTAVAAALAGAMDDALGRWGEITEIPVMPERLWSAAQSD